MGRLTTRREAEVTASASPRTRAGVATLMDGPLVAGPPSRDLTPTSARMPPVDALACDEAPIGWRTVGTRLRRSEDAGRSRHPADEQPPGPERADHAAHCDEQGHEENPDRAQHEEEDDLGVAAERETSRNSV